MTAVSGTSNVWPYYAKGNLSSAGANGNSLGKDEFMKILVAQLSNQDPMQPMEDKEFISQMAQFSSLEQIMNMTSGLADLRQAVSMNSDLIGKQITWTSTDAQTGASTKKSGIVDSIVSKDGEQYVTVGEDQINLKDIESITVPEAAS